MSSRKTSKKGSNKSYTYNFLLPLYNNSGSAGHQPLYYGPLAYVGASPYYDDNHFEIEIPIKESDSMQGTRTVTNLEIELMTCFLQPNDSTGRYERIYPLGVQMVTALLRNGQLPSMVLHEIYEFKRSRNYTPISATKSFKIGEILGRTYNPDQLVLDIRPVLMSNAGGNNPTCTQIVNRVSVTGPIHLDEGDRIAVFFVVPGDLTLFYDDQTPGVLTNSFFIACNGTIRYTVNF